MAYLFKPPPQPALAILDSSDLFPLRRVYCIGKNYAAHVREMGDDPARTTPIFFAKPRDAVDCEPDFVPYPPATTDVHHEVELVAALDGGGVNLTPDEAADRVCGFAVGVDLTRRDLQSAARAKGHPWVTSKGFDHSAPVSRLRLMRYAGLDRDARIRLTVNGDARQDGRLSAMVWPVPEILARLSEYFELRAGDLVFTGTPEGVGPVVTGDRVHAEIEAVGSLAFRVGGAG